jgi:hypothetical protein
MTDSNANNLLADGFLVGLAKCISVSSTGLISIYNGGYNFLSKTGELAVVFQASIAYL